MPVGKREIKNEREDPWYLEAFGALLFFGLAYYTNSELMALEHGTLDSVKMWVPLVWLYNHFGRTATVSVFVIFGVIFLILSTRMLMARK